MKRDKEDQIFGDASKKLEFYSCAKTKNPNTFVEGDSSSFTFFQNCSDANITPVPIDSHISMKNLQLIQY